MSCREHVNTVISLLLRRERMARCTRILEGIQYSFVKPMVLVLVIS